jgi:taurine dioxygenase
MLSYNLLPGAFGIEIQGFNAGQSAGLDEARKVIRALYAHQFVVCRRQNLDEDGFERFADLVGEARPHFLDHLRMKDRPAIIKLSNVFVGGVRTGIFNGAAFWHTDVAYEEPPNAVTTIYAIEGPREAPPLELCDTFAAYDCLPDRTKHLLEGLEAEHHYGNRDDTDETSDTSAEVLTEDQKGRISVVLQPIVKRHPYSGRKSLYGVAGSSFGIKGMPQDEAIDLLGGLKAHATQERFITRHDYRQGDLVMWDNYSTLHRGPVLAPVTPGHPNSRVLWRISVRGVSQLLADEAAPATASSRLEFAL